MLFNYDLFEIVAVGFVISGILIFTMYKSSPIINNESLVNTNSSLNTISNVQLENLPNHNYVEAGVQASNIDVSVQAATHVNTGVQTSSRMWLETIRNWITEILGTPNNPSIVEGHVDVGVQTNGTSLWTTVKQFFLEVCSVRSSELSSIGVGKVDKWRNKLDSVQSVDLQDSESPLDSTSALTQSSLQQLVDPNDSASNISAVVSEGGSNLAQSIYDITDKAQIEVYHAQGMNLHLQVIDNIHYVTELGTDLMLSVDPSILSPYILSLFI